LLVFTISDSLKRGLISGPLVIVGHVIVELFIVIALVFGFVHFIRGFERYIYLIGGLALVIMALLMAKNSGNVSTPKKSKDKYGSIAGGIAFTMFNPSFPLWWITVGYALLLKGSAVLGFFGVILVVVGHWIADFGYYGFVSLLTSRGGKMIYGRVYGRVILILSLFIAIIGVMFVVDSLA